MRGNSIRIAALLMGLAALAAGGKYLQNAELLSYRQQAMLETMGQKQRLVRDARHPVVLLGGGSNALTGLRAEAMAEVLQRPVYNLGLPTEAMDYRNSFALLQSVARPGDVIIYSGRGFVTDAPYNSRHSVYDWNGVPVQLMQRAGRRLLEVPEQSLLRMFLPVNPKPGIWEDPANYNAAGDAKLCVTSGGPAAPLKFSADTESRERFMRDVAAFSNTMKARGVQLLLISPELLVVPEDMPQWLAWQQQTEAEMERLGARWLRIPAHNAFVVDPKAFCDSSFHPTAEHATMKSRMLAQQLAAQGL